MSDSDSESFHSCEDDESDHLEPVARQLPKPQSSVPRQEQPSRVSPPPVVETVGEDEARSPTPPPAPLRPSSTDTPKLRVLDESDSSAASSISDHEEELSVAQRLRLLEEAQELKEPEPTLSSETIAEAMVAEEPEPPHSSLANFKDLFGGGGESSSAGVASVAGVASGFFSGFVSGGLDVLESLGKKTFETLTVKDEVCPSLQYVC